MTDIFLKIAGMSITASFVIAAVLVLRLLLRKAPKAFSYAMWAVVFVRLLCPFEITLPSAPVVPVKIEEYRVNTDTVPTPQDYGDLFFVGSNASVTVFTSTDSKAPEEYRHTRSLISAGTAIWLAGVTLMAAYGAVSYIKLKKRLRNAVRTEDNIYVCGGISNPFIMGVFKPKIYLPENLGNSQRDLIILHEKAHIRRFDHIAKIVIFAALCIHWFNPFVWLAFKLCERDMEMSCDEAVAKNMDASGKADYSQALLDIAAGNTAPFTACFSENGTKRRIKNVLGFKKPALWVSIFAVIILAVSVILIFNGKSGKSNFESYFGKPDYETQTAMDIVLSGALYGESPSITVSNEINGQPEAEYEVKSGSMSKLLYLMRNSELNPVDPDYEIKPTLVRNFTIHYSADEPLSAEFQLFTAVNTDGRIIYGVSLPKYGYNYEISRNIYDDIYSCLDDYTVTNEDGAVIDELTPLDGASRVFPSEIPVVPVFTTKMNSVYFGSEFPYIIYADEIYTVFTEGSDYLFVCTDQTEFTADIKASFDQIKQLLPFEPGADSWNGVGMGSESIDGVRRLYCYVSNGEETAYYWLDTFGCKLIYAEDFSPSVDTRRVWSSGAGSFSGDAYYYSDTEYVYLRPRTIDGYSGSHLALIEIVRHTDSGEKVFVPFPENSPAISSYAQSMIKTGVYSAEDGVLNSVNITVYGGAYFTYSGFSSLIISGVCSVEGERLVISCSTGEQFVFDIDGDTLIFRSGESSPLPDLPDTISDGTVLKYQNE